MDASEHLYALIHDQLHSKAILPFYFLIFLYFQIMAYTEVAIPFMLIQPTAIYLAQVTTIVKYKTSKD